MPGRLRQALTVNTIIGGLMRSSPVAPSRPSKGMVAERKAKRQQEIAENLTPALPSKRTSRVCKAARQK